MRRLFQTLTALAAAAFATAAPPTARPDTTLLQELTVTSRRPMHDIGLQKTTFDSIALRENIALSMADIIAFNSALYVKSYGRATLSTVSFRGTSPSHTAVSWNGLPVNSPMLGMTDFSTIPAYFIDRAQLLHGASSLTRASGGLGGAVTLSTDAPMKRDGMALTYVQGLGSYSTFDEFLRLAWKKGRWQFSTRAVHSSSKNDFTFTNRDKKLNIYDDDHNIIGQYHPKEKNRSGAFRDFHILQEAFFQPQPGDRIGLSIWYADFNRQLPMISTDYGEEKGVDNRQREHTLRSAATWKRTRRQWNLEARAGWIHSLSRYHYTRESAPGTWATLSRSRSLTNSFSADATLNWNPAERWLFTASLTALHNEVESADRRLTSTGAEVPLGYRKGRWEGSAALNARWQPADGAGIALTLREEAYGSAISLPIPALFADWRIAGLSGSDLSWALTFKASGSRNYRYPTLNDLYFMPGGNPDLRCEKGWTYDAGADLDLASKETISLKAGAAWFQSRISDWILWLPTVKGYFSPSNVKTVNARGVELKANLTATLHPDWEATLGGNWAWTKSINAGQTLSPGDASLGKQLPYIPLFSGSATLRLAWKSWSMAWKMQAYGRRYTQTSNEISPAGDLPAYSVSNLSLEKGFRLGKVSLQAKIALNNIFNAQYQTVLSRPMPGTNAEAFLEFRI